jgi:hypothetical protein
MYICVCVLTCFYWHACVYVCNDMYDVYTLQVYVAGVYHLAGGYGWTLMQLFLGSFLLLLQAGLCNALLSVTVLQHYPVVAVSNCSYTVGYYNSCLRTVCMWYTTN